MGKGIYKIRLLREWGRWKPGQIIDATGGVMRELVKRGAAEEYLGYETATAEPQSERAVIPQQPKRKRGRPRKHPVT